MVGKQDGKQGYGGDVLLVDNSEGSYVVPTLELKNQDHDVISKILSGESYWESFLGSSTSCTTYSSRTGGIKLNAFSTFEIPLDFVIDKCLVQEILLQYNYINKFKIFKEGLD
ncbi:hypothetical protein HRI_004845300 [Hibiscus trionum]|uniref:Uncharacterized protein n=1 Tax=Hibiscus trionum TaxID=183268 RepID=A0A9W7JBY6_HIBTR|nr:hypothetical protein HRI_004845300 [Hibiscus trionum]